VNLKAVDFDGDQVAVAGDFVVQAVAVAVDVDLPLGYDPADDWGCSGPYGAGGLFVRLRRAGSSPASPPAPAVASGAR